jgi:trimethylamine--corrinoid protein Co-methyltransferase
VTKMQPNPPTSQPLQLRVLSGQQIDRIVEAALACLDRTGVRVHNREARQLLLDHGAREDGGRILILPELVQEALATTPRAFTLWSRDGEPALQVRTGRVYFGPGPTCTYFVDPDTGARRKVCRGDPGRVAQVCDGLDNIDYVMSLGLIDDVAPELAAAYEFAEMVANTTKPVLGWGHSVENIADIHAIGAAVAGSAEQLRERPFFALFASAQAPLVHTDVDLANMLWAVAHDIPIVYTGGGTAGTTGPITGAGVLVTSLAAMLSGLTIIQLKRPGAPVCTGGIPQGMDPRSCRPSYGGPEMSLYSAAFSDICRALELPFMGTAGASEAKTVDLQAAIESTFQVVMSALSGATLVHDVGFLDCADIGSLEMLVMTDEIIGMMRRAMRGIEVSDETLMLDLIDEIGPGGEFVSTHETARGCRTEIWIPRLMDRDPWAAWEAAGGVTMQERIRMRVGELLAGHPAPCLPAETARRIAQILERAEARVQGPQQGSPAPLPISKPNLEKTGATT